MAPFARLLAAALLLTIGATAARACAVAQWQLTDYPESVVTDFRTEGQVRRAWFDHPVTRYRHFVLGRESEPETLFVDAVGNFGLCGTYLRVDRTHVFEDVAPRLFDVTGDGQNEVIVVRSHIELGAQLVIYQHRDGALRQLAATPYIGQAHRWLAPVGVGDLDGDGAVEVAFVDRPHLARTLRVWRYADGALTEVAAATGVSNHRIGEPVISGGLRDCGEGPEMVVATADWSSIVAVKFDGSALSAMRIGDHTGPESFELAMSCTTG